MSKRKKQQRISDDDERDDSDSDGVVETKKKKRAIPPPFETKTEIRGTDILDEFGAYLWATRMAALFKPAAAAVIWTTSSASRTLSGDGWKVEQKCFTNPSQSLMYAVYYYEPKKKQAVFVGFLATRGVFADDKAYGARPFVFINDTQMMATCPGLLNPVNVWRALYQTKDLPLPPIYDFSYLLAREDHTKALAEDRHSALFIAERIEMLLCTREQGGRIDKLKKVVDSQDLKEDAFGFGAILRAACHMEGSRAHLHKWFDEEAKLLKHRLMVRKQHSLSHIEIAQLLLQVRHCMRWEIEPTTLSLVRTAAPTQLHYVSYDPETQELKDWADEEPGEPDWPEVGRVPGETYLGVTRAYAAECGWNPAPTAEDEDAARSSANMDRLDKIWRARADAKRDAVLFTAEMAFVPLGSTVFRDLPRLFKDALDTAVLEYHRNPKHAETLKTCVNPIWTRKLVGLCDKKECWRDPLSVCEFFTPEDADE